MKVVGYIERKSMLYQTCVEYGDHTMNHVLGCSHGCKYPCHAGRNEIGSVGNEEAAGCWKN